MGKGNIETKTYIERNIEMNNGNYAVNCESASKRFKKKKKSGGLRGVFNPDYVTACQDIDISVRKREIFGIIGPNGSGKSTLIRMLSTLLLPDSGHLEVFGMDVTSETMAVRRLINRVSVDASFFKKLSVRENLSYAARLYGVPRKEALERAAEMLEIFGLGKDKLDEPVEDLSRGQQQMVSIARSLLSSPNLLLLDEPTTGLDPHSKRSVQDFVFGVRDDHDTTVVLTSHDMTEVEKLCDRIAFIVGGKIWATGNANQLKEKGGCDTLEDVFVELTGKHYKKKENDSG